MEIGGSDMFLFEDKSGRNVKAVTSWPAWVPRYPIAHLLVYWARVASAHSPGLEGEARVAGGCPTPPPPCVITAQAQLGHGHCLRRPHGLAPDHVCLRCLSHLFSSCIPRLRANTTVATEVQNPTASWQWYGFHTSILKALGTSHLGDQGGWMNVFPKFSLSWQGSQHNCETKMPGQAGSAVLLLMIKTEMPEAPRPPRSVLHGHKEDALAPGP